jgi:hypothetical protein
MPRLVGAAADKVVLEVLITFIPLLGAVVQLMQEVMGQFRDRVQIGRVVQDVLDSSRPILVGQL